MPLIAQGARRHQVDFYWHLGDFRRMTDVDEDIQHQYYGTLTLDDYRRNAWGDFIANQIVPFGALPVYLGIGNHELYKDADRDKSRADYVAQFAYWLDASALRAGPVVARRMPRGPRLDVADPALRKPSPPSAEPPAAGAPRTGRDAMVADVVPQKLQLFCPMAVATL
jgi:hypothetical protein